MLAQSVLNRFSGVKLCRQGKNWMARCPAHEDRAASLSVGIGRKGQVLLHCFAGCTVEAILEAAGLQIADLFPEENGPYRRKSTRSSAPPRIIKTYDYTDAQGEILFQVCRTQPKGFFQRRPCPETGGWINGLGETLRVLYRLPRVLQAETVYLVEGEKDADALEGLGLTATTCAMGAAKWTREYNLTLAGKNVIILPDNDEPGHLHAEQVAGSLMASLLPPLSLQVVRLADLPPKGDVSDYLKQHTINDLLRQVKQSPRWGRMAEPA